MTRQTILVDGHPVTVERRAEADYISLTDIARRHNEKPANLIANWLKAKATLRFLETWEELFNPDFNLLQMQDIKIESIDNRSVISPQRFIERTGAVGLESSTGRYGGTFAHSDVALEFMSWLDPRYKVFFIREFQRLKREESARLELEWHVERITNLVDETRNWLDTIPGQQPERSRLIPPKMEAEKG